MRSGRTFAAFRTVFAGLTRRLRRGAPPTLSTGTYQRQVRPYLLRALAAYDRWLSVSRDVSAADLLANAASVQRWEFLSWCEHLAEVTAPPELERLHLQVLQALREAARASQLLALGYRATTYSTVCDGQSLLTDSTESLRRALQQCGRVEPPHELGVPALERRAS